MQIFVLVFPKATSRGIYRKKHKSFLDNTLKITYFIKKMLAEEKKKTIFVIAIPFYVCVYVVHSIWENGNICTNQCIKMVSNCEFHKHSSIQLNIYNMDVKLYCAVKTILSGPCGCKVTSHRKVVFNSTDKKSKCYTPRGSRAAFLSSCGRFLAHPASI